MLNNFSRYRRYVLGSFWTELKYRYAGTSVGFFWFFVNPLLEVIIYTVVFSYLINFRSEGQRTSDYVVFLCVGLFPWLAFVENLSKGSVVLLANRLYLNRLAIPPSIFVAKNSLLSLFTLLIYSVILIFVLLLFGYELNWTLVFIPLIGILFQLMGFGISLILSHLHVLIPDVGEILSPLLQLWRWTLPILYRDDIFPQGVQTLLRWNPPYFFISSFRSVLIDHQLPSLEAWLFMGGWTFVFIALGSFVAGKLSSDIKDEL